MDANWYQGERGGTLGFFPASYVQVLIPLPNGTVPQCAALYDFKMSSAEDEKDCLTFAKGQVVTVIRRVDENWAEGRLAERIGIFPISFVEMNSAAKHLMKSSLNFHPGPSRSAPALPCGGNNSVNNSLNLLTPETIVPREKRFSQQLQQPQAQSAQQRRSSAEISSSSRNPAEV